MTKSKAEVLEWLERELADRRTRMRCFGGSVHIQAYKDEQHITAAISMLQRSTVWTPCTEQLPTEADMDAEGDFYVRHPTIKNILCMSLKQFSVLEREDQNEFEWARIERSTAS